MIKVSLSMRGDEVDEAIPGKQGIASLCSQIVCLKNKNCILLQNCIKQFMIIFKKKNIINRQGYWDEK